MRPKLLEIISNLETQILKVQKNGPMKPGVFQFFIMRTLVEILKDFVEE